MILDELGFAGYQCFPITFFQPEPELVSLRFAPLTVILGKNNSGKSALLKLVRQCLVAMAETQAGPFPLDSSLVERPFAQRFRQLQHCGYAENPIHLEIGASAGEKNLRVVAQIHRLSDSDEEPSRKLRRWQFQSQDFSGHTADNGLLPDEHPESLFWRKSCRSLLESSHYLGPIRPMVEASFPVRASDDPPQRLLAYPEVCQRVSAWCQEHLDGWGLKVSQTLDQFEILVSRGGIKDINLAQAGQGFQQVLPLLVNCHWRQVTESATPWLDFLDQPELHLHDAAHAGLADLLIQSLRPGLGHYLVETHSENFLLRLRRRVAEGRIRCEDLAFYYVDERAKVTRIDVDSSGEVSAWPQGVFSEAFEEIKAIHRARHQE